MWKFIENLTPYKSGGYTRKESYIVTNNTHHKGETIISKRNYKDDEIEIIDSKCIKRNGIIYCIYD